MNFMSDILDNMEKRINEYSKKLDEEKQNRKESIDMYKWSIKNRVVCSECSTHHDKIGNNYCIKCGHKLKKITNDKINKKYCPLCGEKVNMDVKYCSKYGHEIKIKRKVEKCPICGEWKDEERYCINCGHDKALRRKSALSYNESVVRDEPKKCPNCNTKYPRFFNYCEKCGTKLIRTKW